jgi:hypothetical protein
VRVFGLVVRVSDGVRLADVTVTLPDWKQTGAGTMTSFVRRSLRATALAIALVSIDRAHVTGAAWTDEDSLRPEFVQAQQANAAALREYTWKSRTELRFKGDVKSVKLEQVRHDFDGRLEKTAIGGSPAPSDDPFRSWAPRVGPVQRVVTARKKAEVRDLMQDLSSLVQSYANPSLETLHAFARQAARTRTIEAGLVRVQARNLVVTGDSMTVWIDPSTGMIRRAEVETVLEGDRVEMAVDYRSLTNGLTYQARTVLRYPHKQMSLTTETYDHQLLTPSR